MIVFYSGLDWLLEGFHLFLFRDNFNVYLTLLTY